MKQSKKIALSAISTAGASIFLILGNTISVLDYSFYLLASVCVMAPLFYDDIWGSILTFIASTLIGLIFVPNIMVMFAFFAFFAPYVIIMSLLENKNVNKIVAYVIKGVFFAATLVLFYFFTELFVEFSSYNLPIALIAALGFIFLFVYDFFMMRIRKLLSKIVDKVVKRGN